MTGTAHCPPVIIGNLCAWLTICSKTRNSSDGIWNSTTGRNPASAAPVAKLVNACSDSGVSRTRSGPNRFSRPGVTLDAPTRMSSPSRNTASSRVISSVSARVSALR